MSDRDLISEGREKLTALVPELLPLDVDRTVGPSGVPEDIGFFVCDRSGLEFAAVRNEDKATAALIAWALNNLPALLDELERMRSAHDAARDIARSNSHALDAAQRELCTARELIDWFADDEPCDFDHHHGCQAHGHYEPDTCAECPNAIALRWLAAHPLEEAEA